MKRFCMWVLSKLFPYRPPKAHQGVVGYNIARTTGSTGRRLINRDKHR